VSTRKLGPAARVRQTARLLRSEGTAGVAQRIAKRAANLASPVGQGRLLVERDDLLRVAEIAAAGWELPPALPARPGEPLTFAWVCVPPGPGSGGHTTMFRMLSALEQAGHTCVLYLDDRHGWELAEHEKVIRTWWPHVQAEVRDLRDGIEDCHGIFATAWHTAYRVLASPARGQRFYFVQDFEPSFYPAGSDALMAEATYRFGFHGVTAGRWLAQMLGREYGMAADHFDFGRDPGYELDRSDGAAAGRAGVCFYSRPETARRAYELGIAALDIFAVSHPQVEIHLYGREVRKPPFAATQHGLLTPAQLNELYNRCVAGLSLSATNVSLVPHEMLAAGCIPVVNDAEHNRVVLDNEHVAYAPATPFDLANALGALVDRSPVERAAAAETAAASVQDNRWEDAGTAVVRIVTDVVAAASQPGCGPGVTVRAVVAGP
jgi:WsaF, C-terminal domain/WsaF, N-terminal domain